MKRLCILSLFLVLSGLSLAQTPKVYVFLPSNIRPHIMKQSLAKACEGVDFEVFGRFREFDARIKRDPPDAIISLEPVISRQKDVTALLLGAKAGKVQEEYVLLSRDRPVEIEKLSEQAIGVVDLLGRSQMNQFLALKLDVTTVARVRTVTKLEDLLSLLQFQEADAIFVPESKIDYYLGRTVLELEVTRLQDALIGLPVVAALNTDPEMVRIITQALQSADKALDETLGVEQWVRP